MYSANGVFSRCACVAPEIVCTVPHVDSGQCSTVGWANQKNGSIVDSGQLLCNVGYHRTSRTEFYCSCEEDGQPCGTLYGACTPNMCTRPNVVGGVISTSGWWVDHRNGMEIVESAVVCDAGFHRSNTSDFTCVCLIHNQQCSDITNACDMDIRALHCLLLHYCSIYKQWPATAKILEVDHAARFGSLAYCVITKGFHFLRPPYFAPT